MKKKAIILLTIGGLLMATSCSTDDTDQMGSPVSATPTRQTTSDDESDENDGDDVMLDEMGALPVVAFYSVDEEDSVKVSPGESQTGQAPLNLHLKANVSNPDGYKCLCEWRIWRTSDNGSENNPLATRFEENTTYTLTRSGGYGVKLYITFSLDGDTIEYESEQMSVVISESKLKCPDGFSPNGDGINDSLRVTAQSIIKLEVDFFTRWGQKIHSTTLATAKRAEGEPNKLIIWDGKANGKIVSDGIYLMHLEALGSDGVKYKIKKTISVMTGFKEGTETPTGGGGSSE